MIFLKRNVGTERTVSYFCISAVLCRSNPRILAPLLLSWPLIQVSKQILLMRAAINHTNTSHSYDISEAEWMTPFVHVYCIYSRVIELRSKSTFLLMLASKDIKTLKPCIPSKLYLIRFHIQERNFCIQETCANIVCQSTTRCECVECDFFSPTMVQQPLVVGASLQSGLHDHTKEQHIQ